MGDPIDIPTSNNNPKELNKGYYAIVKLSKKASNSQCENCKNSSAIGRFRINSYEYYFEDSEGCNYVLESKKLDLCQNCYLELKKNQKLPKPILALYKFSESQDLSKWLNVIGKYRVKTLDFLINLAVEKGFIEDRLEEKFFNLSMAKKSQLILELMSKKLIGKNIFGKMVNVENLGLFYNRKNLLKEAQDISQSLLKTLFPSPIVLSDRGIDHILTELKSTRYSRYMFEKEYNERVNPIRYRKFRNCILDTVNFEIVDNLEGYYFTYEIPIEIDRDYFKKLRNSMIDESYFEKSLFYETFRGFYTKKDPILGEEYWNILEYCYGSIICFGLNEKRRIFIIHGDPNTGKSTLMQLTIKALGDFVQELKHDHLKDDYRWAFHPIIKGKGLGIFSEKPIFTIKNVELLKAITGERYIEVEKKHADSIQKENMFRMFFICNDLPEFDEYDEAFLSRIVLIETSNPIIKKDRYLLNELEKKENMKVYHEWLLYSGWQYWKRSYITPDEKDEEYNEHVHKRFLEAKDFLKEFIEEMCEIGEEYNENRTYLYSAFSKFREERGLSHISNQKFYDALRRKGFKEAKIHGDYYVKGLRLKEKKEEQDSLFDFSS